MSETANESTKDTVVVRISQDPPVDRYVKLNRDEWEKSKDNPYGLLDYILCAMDDGEYYFDVVPESEADGDFYNWTVADCE